MKKKKLTQDDKDFVKLTSPHPVDFKKQGKKSRAAGARFELKVRADLEKKGWIVDKWSNNVELVIHTKIPEVTTKETKETTKVTITTFDTLKGKLVKVKNKFLGPGKPIMLGAGFPDFIAYHYIGLIHGENSPLINKIKASFLISVPFEVHQIFGIECRSNGYLSKEEKEKCKWLLNNKIFATIFIAKKGKKRGEIIYEEFKTT